MASNRLLHPVHQASYVVSSILLKLTSSLRSDLRVSEQRGTHVRTKTSKRGSHGIDDRQYRTPFRVCCHTCVDAGRSCSPRIGDRRGTCSHSLACQSRAVDRGARIRGHGLGFGHSGSESRAWPSDLVRADGRSHRRSRKRFNHVRAAANVLDWKERCTTAGRRRGRRRRRASRSATSRRSRVVRELGAGARAGVDARRSTARRGTARDRSRLWKRRGTGRR